MKSVVGTTSVTMDNADKYGGNSASTLLKREWQREPFLAPAECAGNKLWWIFVVRCNSPVMSERYANQICCISVLGVEEFSGAVIIC